MLFELSKFNMLSYLKLSIYVKISVMTLVLCLVKERDFLKRVREYISQGRRWGLGSLTLLDERQ